MYSVIIILLMLFFAMMVAATGAINNVLPQVIFSQPSSDVTSPLNETQEWVSQKDAVKILFAYQPERPIIDTFTKLEFSIINMTNNENLKDFDARVAVTNGQRLFKFENITVQDGDFLVEYIFPDDGTHQVITRIDKGADVQVLASFNVFVPHQAPPSLLNPFPNASANEMESLMRALTIVISFSIIIIVVIMLRKGKGRKKRNRQRL
ncbi:MAG: hypothetical protein WAU25_13100 [Nitrososphaeraceae archaeon]